MKAQTAIVILVFAIIIGVGIRKYPSYLPSYVTNILEITRLKNRFSSTQTTFDYDLIIVGSGLAGLTSAFEANKLFNGQKKNFSFRKITKIWRKFRKGNFRYKYA